MDPQVDETGQPYAYTGDDPVNEVDPSGLHVCDGNPLTWGGCVGNASQGVAGAAGNDYSLLVQADQWTGNQIASALCANGASNGVLAGSLDCGQFVKNSNCQPISGFALSLQGGSLQKLSKGQLKMLRANGEDPESLKQDIYGSRVSAYDLYMDKSTGDVYAGPKTPSSGDEFQPVGINLRGGQFSYSIPITDPDGEFGIGDGE